MVSSERSAFTSRIGFVLTAVGFAIGLGNIWRFPQLVSQNGGAAFVLLYLIVVLIIGIPLLWAELSIGQRGRLSAPGAIQAVAGPSWRWVGLLFVFNTFLLFGYYHVLAGVVLKYLVYAPTGAVAADPPGFLAASAQGPGVLGFTLLFVAITTILVSLGVVRGLERANLIMMPGLFFLMVALAIYAVFQPGAGAGLSFYLRPDFGEMSFGTLHAALNQAFFSIGIAMGFHVTAACYLRQQKPMLNNAALIAGADALVAFVAGFFVFPLLFSQGVESLVLDSGTGTKTALFLSVPTALADVGGFLGGFLMVVFFLALTFAALSSAIALMEVLVSWMTDAFGWSRRRAAIIAAEFGIIPGVFAAFSETAFNWLDTLLGFVFLFAGGVALCLLFALGIQDRLGMLLAGDGQASIWTQRAARAVQRLVVYVIPVVLVAVFVLNRASWLPLFGLG